LSPRFLIDTAHCQRSSSALASTSSFFVFSMLIDLATALTSESELSVQSTEMRAPPESEGCCSMRINLELQNGTWSLHPMSVQR
jgi:hypothetical protein